MLALLTHYLPLQIFSGLFRAVTLISRPKCLAKALIALFAKAYGIDPALAITPSGGYKSLLEFFLREPKAEARPDRTQKGQLASPVEAMVAQAGPLKEDTFLVVKGETCTIKELLGHDDEKYLEGLYAILYLSPADFHRIYAPENGTVEEAHEIKGSLKPVFQSYVRRYPKVFVTNQRVNIELKLENGAHVMLSCVGALNVGRIPAAFPLPYDSSSKFACGKGQELARFEFGSTVVVFLEKGRFAFAEGMKPGRKILLGEPLALTYDSN